MNLKGKKFISLFLIFSLIMISVSLYAKERRGAKLIVTKKDGQRIEGELITVKPNSLLLLNTEGKDVSVDIADIKVVTIVKKSKAGIGAGIGFLVGGATGALTSLSEEKEKSASFWAMYYMSFMWLFIKRETAESVSVLITGLVYGIGGALLGGLIGTILGKNKTIQIECMIDSEIRDTLDKLRKKARVRDYR